MFYVLDDSNNKVEAYDKEGFLAFLEDAIANHTLEGIAADSAFVDKLKCSVGGGTYKVAFVTQATYNNLAANNQLITNCYYYITDDTTCEDIDDSLQNLTNQVNGIGDNVQTNAEGIQDLFSRVVPMENTLANLHLYEHNVYFNFSGVAVDITIKVITASATPITAETLPNYISTNSTCGTMASGFYHKDSVYYTIDSIYKSGNYTINYHSNDSWAQHSFSTIGTLNDVVRDIQLGV